MSRGENRISDEFGLPVASAAINILDADTSAIEAKTKTATLGRPGKWSAIGLEIARRLVLESDDGHASLKTWHAVCNDVGMRPSSRYDVLTRLQARGEIVLKGDVLGTPVSSFQSP